MINFEEVIEKITDDLEKLGLTIEPSFSGLSIPPNGNIFFFEKGKNTLSVRFALNYQMNAINGLKLKYKDLYKENFEPHVNTLGTLNDVTFNFFQ